MAPENPQLDFEQAVAAIVGLIGRPVDVSITYRTEKGGSPIVALSGILRRGTSVNPVPALADRHSTEGETLLLELRRSDEAIATLVVAEENFEGALQPPDEVLGAPSLMLALGPLWLLFEEAGESE